jgi:type III secretion protein J
MRTLLAFLVLLLLAGCGADHTIVNNVQERDANEIVVFLASKGIEAQKVVASSATPGGATAANLFNIVVSSKQAVEAMALLNRYGLPRRMGTNLLTLFAKSGLMSTDREETIRYQAGLAEQLRNTISKMDAVLDADVELSFPPETGGGPTPGSPPSKVTAAVYIKLAGMEDPNNHIETKIKRLLAGSVPGLEYDNVSVITDRSHFATLSLSPEQELIGAKSLPQAYASIWSIVMTKGSLVRFRFIFFTFIGLLILLSGALAWMTYKYYFTKKETPPTAPLP